jgi:hypothetical protein
MIITPAITTTLSKCNINIIDDGVIIHEEIKQEIATTTRIKMSPTNDATHTNNTTARQSVPPRIAATTPTPKPRGLQQR